MNNHRIPACVAVASMLGAAGLDGDGVVGLTDCLILLASWGR